MIKKSIFIFMMGAVLFACNSEDNSDKNSKEKSDTTEVSGDALQQGPILNPNVLISGNINNGGHATLFLEANTDKGSMLINKTSTDKEGNFKMEGAISSMGLYQLRLDQGQDEQQNPKVIPMTLVPGDTVMLQLDFDDFNTSVIYKGTEWAEPLNGYMTELRKFIDWQKSIPDPRQYPQDQLLKMVMEQKKPMDKFITNQIRKDADNPANILLMTNLMPMMGYDHFDPENLKVLKLMHKAFEESYPESPMTVTIGSQVAELEQGYKDYQDYEVKKMAPEISLPNPAGEIIKLSSLRGNYVLIDFWASWCMPCRAENPNNVRLYNKYKNKKFKIFSVSLDDNKEKWEEAIKADHLDWKYHVSDLLKWNTPLIQKYNFNAIPHMVLIDPDGKIIGENLRGQSLERKLQEIFGN